MLPALVDQGWIAVLGRPVTPLLAGTGLLRTAGLADLAVCGRHLAEEAGLALLGFFALATLAAVLALAGIGIARQLPVWAGLLAACVGLIVSDLALASEARKRRAELRDAVAGTFDLVAIGHACGAGVEQSRRHNFVSHVRSSTGSVSCRLRSGRSRGLGVTLADLRTSSF